MSAIAEHVETGSLADIAEVVMGQSPAGTSYNRDGDGAALINGPTEFTRRYPVPKQWTTAPGRFCKAGDELICVRGSSTGRMNTADQVYCIGRGVAAVRAKPSNDQNYVRFALSAVVTDLLKLQSGSTFPSIDARVIRGGAIFLPSYEEQVQIGRALGDIDDQISAIEELIAKKQAIKQGMMQQLLTGKTRLPGFTEPWVECRLGDVLTVRHGKSQKAVKSPSGKYPILATGGQIGWADTPLYAKPSVLIGRKGTIDRPQFQATPFWTVDTLFYTEVSASADPRYLYYCFLTVDWRSMNEASGVPSLSACRVEGVKVHLPHTDEQQAIRSVLDDAHSEVMVLRARLDKARAVKQGMMQELLTGRTRLRGSEDSDE